MDHKMQAAAAKTARATATTARRPTVSKTQQTRLAMCWAHPPARYAHDLVPKMQSPGEQGVSPDFFSRT